MEQLSTKVKIGELVKKYPTTAKVFKDYKVDYCCGGHKELCEIIQESNLPEAELVEKLSEACKRSEELRASGDKFEDRSSTELVDYVVNVHHAYLNANMPSISEHITKILRVHGKNHPELKELHSLFHEVKMEMEQHMIKEEEDAFVAIKAYEADPNPTKKQKIGMMIEMLEAEHTASGDVLKTMREITNDYALPDDACGTFRYTYQKLEEFESDMFQHIHLENNIIFPRFLNH